MQQVCPSRVASHLYYSGQLHSGVHSLPHPFTQSEGGCRGDEHWWPASIIQTGRFVPGDGTGSQSYSLTTQHTNILLCMIIMLSVCSNWSQKFQTDLRSVDYIFCVGKSLIIIANQSWNMFSVYTLSFLDPSLHVSPPYWRENSLIVLDLEVCKQKLSQ